MSSGRGSKSPFSTPRGTSIEIDHHDIPIARLRLLDNGQPRAGAFEFLDINLDVVRLLERLQERRIGMVAPDECVEFLRAKLHRPHDEKDRTPRPRLPSSSIRTAE